MHHETTSLATLLETIRLRPRGEWQATSSRGLDEAFEEAIWPSHRTSPQRRVEPRFEPIEDRLWVQWFENGDLHGRSARLVNISHHGAMIVSSARFSVDWKICLYLEEPAPQIAVRARVLEVIEGLHGLDQVRLVFDVPCPDAFFEAAANGFESWLEGATSTL